jgi:uncharacterized protein YciI
MMATWLYILRPPRQTFSDDMTEEEREVTQAHVAYLRQLLDDGKLVLAGPSLSPLFGIVVLDADDEDEARRIASADPFVSSGLQTAELSPFRVSFLRGRD